MADKGMHIESLISSEVQLYKDGSKLSHFREEVKLLLTTGNSTFVSLKVSISRWLFQFRLRGLYSEAYVINEAYLRGISLIRDQNISIQNPPAWLRRTCFNIIRELSRKEDKYLPIVSDTWFDHRLSSFKDFDPSLFLDQKMMYVRLAFQVLEDDDQEILNLKIVDGLSWKQIHHEFQLRGKSMTLDALRKKKQRALNKLRENYHNFVSSSES